MLAWQLGSHVYGSMRCERLRERERTQLGLFGGERKQHYGNDGSLRVRYVRPRILRQRQRRVSDLGRVLASHLYRKLVRFVERGELRSGRQRKRRHRRISYCEMQSGLQRWRKRPLSNERQLGNDLVLCKFVRADLGCELRQKLRELHHGNNRRARVGRVQYRISIEQRRRHNWNGDMRYAGNVQRRCLRTESLRSVRDRKFRLRQHGIHRRTRRRHGTDSMRPRLHRQRRERGGMWN